jgi:uncharacterized coiled-coil DUF342 family protein
MADAINSAVSGSVRKARRRMIVQTALNSTAVAWAGALGGTLGWVLLEPWVLENAPANLRWQVLGGLAAGGTLAAGLYTWLTRPSANSVALEVDQRFDLRERVTTALGLSETERATPAGQAVLADAQLKVAGLRVPEKFPVRPRKHVALVPTLAAGIAAAVFFYHPDTASALGGEGPGKKLDEKLKDSTKDANKTTAAVAKPKPPELARANKSADLEKLEAELDKMMEKWAKQPTETAEKAREKVAELTKMEDKIKKFNDEKFEKLAQLEKQLQQLDRLNKDNEFKDGPAKELNDALSKGDLKKAQDEVDELRKKAKENKLTPQDLERLDKQLDKMKQETEKLARDKEKEQKLKDLIDKAKKEGRDADSLERELDKLKSEMKEYGEAMERMAERMQKMQQAIKQGDMQDLADQMEKMAGQLKEMEEELKDLEEGEDSLQRLKDELKKACKSCGECEGKEGKPDRKDFATGKGVGSGLRDIDRDVKTNSTEERIRGLFDPRGKKQYGGTTRGPAFTKKSNAEMGKEIQQAVQEAPAAVETQRLPRDAQENVKEYFEKLGNTGGK